MPFAAVKDGKLFYKITGEGPPIVLIHGAWGSQEWWRWQIPYLSANFQVLTFDLRGHGKSSPLQHPYSIPEFTKDLEILLQNFGNETVALIGWSLGGMISLQFSLKKPDRVKALILIATRGHVCPKTKKRLRLEYFLARLGLLLNLSAPRKYDRDGESFPGERERTDNQVRQMIGPGAPREVLEWIMEDLNRNPRSQYFEIAKSFWDWDISSQLDRITAPTLILTGEKDDWVPPIFSHLLHDRIHNSELVVIEGAGHCLPLECPERVNDEINSFLRRTGQ